MERVLPTMEAQGKSEAEKEEAQRKWSALCEAFDVLVDEATRRARAAAIDRARGPAAREGPSTPPRRRGSRTHGVPRHGDRLGARLHAA